VAESLPKDRPNSGARQDPRHPRIQPELDETLLDRDEVCVTWEVSDWAVRKAVAGGELRRVRRRGYQAYYLFSDVVACFGEPKNPPPELMGG
jgi:hypothetical protein